MNLRRTILGVSFIVFAAILVALFLRSGEERPEGDEPQPSSETDPVILAADSSGAILYRDGVITGVERGKGEVWTRTVKQLPTSIICVRTCPHALLSGADGGPLSEDPEPTTEYGAQLPLPEWADPTGGKNEILAAGPNGALRVITESDGTAWWEMTRPDGQVEREPAVGANAIWFPATDGTAGVAMLLSTTEERYLQQALVSRKDGWHVLSEATANDVGGSGCVAPGGTRWIVDGREIEGGPTATRLQVDGRFGNCAFTGGTLVLAGNTKSAEGARTQVVGVDDQGAEQWQKDIESEAFVSGSSAQDEFAVMGDGSRTVTVFNGAGEQLKVMNGWTFAIFDETGSLVMVSPDGKVKWVDV